MALQPGMQQFLIETLESSTKLMQAKNFKVTFPRQSDPDSLTWGDKERVGWPRQ